MSEIDDRYHVRQLQVRAIFLEANELFDQEIAASQVDFHLLDDLLKTPPILRDFLIRRSNFSREDFYDGAFRASAVNIRGNTLLSILYDLYGACDEFTRMEAEIGIDDLQLADNLPFSLAFKDEQERFNQVVVQAKEEGIGTLLKSLERQETPLIRYRRDLAAAFGLSPAIHGEVAVVTTRIPQVELKLWYPGLDLFPKLSILVHRFTD